MRAIVLLALVAAATALVKNEESRIISGGVASIEQYPFMASLQILQDDIFLEQVCGGSLITPVTVLTAGTCFIYEPSSLLWRVRLGSSMASSGGSLHSVARVVIHPGIDYTTRNNDIATMRLATPAVFSSTINRARIAGIDYNLPEGTWVAAAGWGVNMRSNSEILLHADLYITNQERCVESYAVNSTASWKVTNNQICTSAAICVGDYGGPIVHDGDVVIGVMSFAYNCGAYEFPSVSTRVSLYSDWVSANA